jgi:hypothetical protein
VYGPSHACPHCGGVTRAVAEGKRGWVCGACGGPRVRGVGRDPELDAALARVKRGWYAEGPLSVLRVMFALLALTGALGGAELAATLGIHLVSGAFLALWIGGWIAAALAVGARRRRAMEEGEKALGQARLRAAALLVAKSPEGVAPARLAEALAVPEPEAERLLTELAATNEVRIDLERDDEVRFRVSQPPVIEDAHDEAAPLSHEHRRRGRDLG